MRIKNIDGLTAGDLQREADNGARFIFFAWTISLIVVTFKRTSGVYLVRSGTSTALKGLPYTVLSLLLGWWGFPFGPKYTIGSILTNLKGGKDVTDDVMATVAGYVQFREAELKKKS